MYKRKETNHTLQLSNLKTGKALGLDVPSAADIQLRPSLLESCGLNVFGGQEDLPNSALADVLAS